MSDHAASLAAALAALQARLPRITKAAEGQRSRYADLPAVTAALLPVLSEFGLSFTACPTLLEMGGEVKFVLNYCLRHAPTGESEEGFYPLGTGNPQQLGSAITYARRYCLLAVTGAAPDDGSDDDGAAASEPRRWEPEVREDGSATEAEQARWRHGKDPSAWRSSGTAENDPWYDPAKCDHSIAPGGGPCGVTVVDPRPPQDQPGTVQPAQWKLMSKAMPGVDWKDGDAVRAECARRLGRPVPTRGALSYNDAKAIIEWKEPAGA